MGSTIVPAHGASLALVMSEHGQPSDVADESVLDALEADLAAVEHAIERLDQVTEQGIGGDEAAEAIAVAVPPERFELPAG